MIPKVSADYRAPPQRLDRPGERAQDNCKVIAGFPDSFHGDDPIFFPDTLTRIARAGMLGKSPTCCATSGITRRDTPVQGGSHEHAGGAQAHH